MDKANDKQEVFKKLVNISMPISFGEMAVESELNPKEGMGKVNGIYAFFKIDSGMVGYYISDVEMSKKIEHAGKMDLEALQKELGGYWESIKDIIINEPQLNHYELKEFISTLRKDFGWMDCMWYMVEYYDKHDMDVSEVIKLRKLTEHFVPGVVGVLRKSLKAIFPDYSKFVDFLTLEEILSKNLPDIEAIKKRQKSFFIAGKFYNTVKESGLALILEKEEIDTNADILKGQTAFPGKVVGTVKIVKNRDDMKGFNKGDIIVSPTTTPDFLPIMKKSGAIISEHGGVICHASITSRELKIPCIVGVQGAVQVLKNGDKVEVNANEGVVRILNN